MTSNHNGFENDYKKILSTIKKANKSIPTIYKINEKNVEKVWKSRINSVSLQESVKEDKISDNIDFDKIDNAKADSSIKLLLRSYPSNIKDMMGILNNKTTNQNKLKSLFEMLEGKGVAKNEIKTKCNL